MSERDLTAVEASGLRKVYGRGGVPVEALHGVDLTVGRGEFLAVIGPSGSGKTTLLNLLGGLDRPTDGQLRIGGQPVDGLSASRMADLRLRHIGFVFQDYNLIPVLTARENIEYVMLLQGIDRHTRRERARAILEEVGLGGLGERRPAALSGGQQQRVAVARAIVTQPDIVLADEPTANLDSETGAALIDLMRRLNREKQVTIIVSTHDPMVIERVDRVVRMHDGTLTA